LARCPGHGAAASQPKSRKATRKAERRAAAVARAQVAAAAASQALLIREQSIPEPVASVERPAAVETVEPRPAVPLPPARALVARRQGFVDILAFVLRDSGRRLARWSSARRRADEMKEKLARAEARMRAMEAQLAALQAIQQRVRSINS
jgi:hypothetical protein